MNALTRIRQTFSFAPFIWGLIWALVFSQQVTAQTRYELVSDAADIESGASYLIVGYTAGNYYALGAQNGNYRSGVKIALQTEKADDAEETTFVTIINEEVVPVTLIANGDYYNLQTTADSYLYGESGGSALQETSSANANTALWEVVGVTSAGSTRLRNRNGNYLRFYANGTIFRAPSSESGNTVRLFKSTTPTALSMPTFSPKDGQITVGQTVRISAVGSGAHLQVQSRSSDGVKSAGEFSEWEDFGSVVQYPLSTPGIIEIRARSVSADGTQFSEVAEARYTVVASTPDETMFERIDNTEQFVVGGTYLIVFSGSVGERSATVALGSQSGNNRDGVPVEIVDGGMIDIAACAVRPTVLTIQSITPTGKITFLTDDATPAFLYTPSTDVNELRTRTSSEDGDNTKYIITFTGETATIANAAGKRYIGVNLTVDKGMFRTYTSPNESAGISTSLQVFANRSTLTSLPSHLSTISTSTPTIYDLQGRRITHPTKGGLYIIGGIKTFIR